MSATYKNIVLKLVPFAILFLLILLRIADPNFIQTLRLKSFDLYQQAWPREKAPTEKVFILDIDEKSLSEMGQWPWPRTFVAELVEKAFKQGTKVMAFDMVFAEVDRTSPDQAMEYWNLDYNTQESLKNLKNHDKHFAELLKEYPVVGGIVFTQDAQGKSPLLKNKSSVNQIGALATEWLPNYEHVVTNIPTIQDSFSSFGSFGYVPSSDNIIRKINTFSSYQNQLYPSLVVETLRLFQGDKTPLFIKTDKQTGVSSVKVGKYVLPTDEHGQFWVRYRSYHRLNYISATDLYHNRLPKGMLDDAILLVGTSALGLLDMRATPVNPVTPGVDVHAQMLETIFTGTNLNRPSFANTVEIFYILIAGLFLIKYISRFKATFAFLGALWLIALTIGTSIILYISYGYLFDIMYPIVTITLSFIVQNTIRFAREERERRSVRHAFQHYLAPEVIQTLSKAPEKLSLGGENKELTLMFTDIRSFTTISEHLSPKQLTDYLNHYLTPMTEIVQHTKGTIDKYIGDAIMAFWNAPMDVQEHAKQACKAAVKMLQELSDLNKYFVAHNLPEMKIGIGIHTDIVSVGNMGSKQRFNYTVIGDGVNLASRLEGLSKFYGVDIVVSGSVKNQVPEGHFVPLDLVAVKGKQKPVDVYELIWLGDGIPENKVEELLNISAAIDAFRAQDWTTAKRCLDKVLEHRKLVDIYRQRIKEFEDNPPEKDWDGVFYATDK